MNSSLPEETPHDSFRNLQNHILNNLLFYGTLATVPVQILFFLTRSQGNEIIQFQFIQIVTLWILWFFRHRLSYYFRAIGLILISIATGFTDRIVVGPSSDGDQFVIMAILLTVLLLGRRASVITLGFSSLLMVIFAYASVNHFLEFHINYTRYYHDSGMWFVRIWDFVFFNGVMLYVATTLIQNLLQEQKRRNRTEMELRTSYEKQRAIFSTTGLGVAILNEDSVIVEVNRQFEVFLGYGPDELPGKSIRILYSNEEEFLHFTGNIYSRLTKTGHVNFESRLKTRSGSDLPVYMSLSLMDPKNPRMGVSMILTDISELDFTRRAYQESESRLKSILHSMEDQVFILDKNGIITELYQREEMPNALPRENTLGHFFFDIFNQEVADQIQNAFNSIQLHSTNFQFEYSSGEGDRTRWFSALVTGRHSEEGKFSGVTIVSRNITHLKQMEILLESSLEHYKQLFSESKAVLLLIDPDMDGAIVDANRTALDFYGYTLEEIRQLRISDFNTLPYHDLKEQTDEAQNNKNSQFFFKHRLKSGEIKDVEVHSGPVQIQGKQMLFSIIHDISEKRAAEEALRQSEAKNRSIIDTTPEGVWIINPSRVTIDVNQGLCRMLGYTKEEMLGKRPSDFVDEINAEIFRKQLGTIETTDHRSYEVELRRKDGISRTCLFHASTLRNAEGEIEFAVALVSDISDQKQLQMDLVQALEDTERANKVRSLFIASMNHELRTPLNSILGYSRLMKVDSSIPPEARKKISVIEKNGNHLLGLINDILDMSKIEAGRMEVHKAPFDLNQLIHDLKDMHFPLAHKKGINFEIQLSWDLDSPIQEGAIPSLLGDEIRLRQGLINLLTNAIKFTELGTVKLDILFGKNNIHFHVSDTGRGIDSQDFQTIFEPFRQVGGSQKEPGTGLGLPITRKLVEIMGGVLSLQSEKGKGSIFSFTIPIELDPESTYQEQEIKNRIVPEEEDSEVLQTTRPDPTILQELETCVNMGDIKRIREELENLARTYPEHSPTWEIFTEELNRFDLNGMKNFFKKS